MEKSIFFDIFSIFFMFFSLPILLSFMFCIIPSLYEKHIVLIIIIFKIFSEVLVCIRCMVLKRLHSAKSFGWVGHSRLFYWYHNWRLLNHYFTIRSDNFNPYWTRNLFGRIVLSKRLLGTRSHLLRFANTTETLLKLISLLCQLQLFLQSIQSHLPLTLRLGFFNSRQVFL